MKLEEEFKNILEGGHTSTRAKDMKSSSNQKSKNGKIIKVGDYLLGYHDPREKVDINKVGDDWFISNIMSRLVKVKGFFTLSRTSIDYPVWEKVWYSSKDNWDISNREYVVIEDGEKLIKKYGIRK